MAQYVDDLSNYQGLENTESCYLDGRYFNLVFQNYPGLLPHHLHIDISETHVKTPNRNEIVDNSKVFMGDNRMDPNFNGLLRVVIHTPETMHSNLLIIDYENRKIYRFEPLGKEGPHYEKVTDLIAKNLSHILPFDIEVLDVRIPFDEQNEKCEKSGYCVAYIILYAYAYLKQTTFNPAHIRKFAKLIETKYGPLPKEGAQIEYGPRRGGDYGGHRHGGYRGDRGYGGYRGGYGGYGGVAPFIGGVGLGLGLGLPLAAGYGYPAYGYPAYGYPAYGYGYPGYGYGYGYGNEGAVLGGILGGTLGAAALSGGL